MKHVFVSFLGIHPGAFLNNAAQPSAGQLLGGVPAREQDVQQHPQGVDVRPLVGLGDAVLLRSGIAGGAQDLGVPADLILEDPGGVEVDEDRLVSPEDDVFCLDVPVDDAMEWSTHRALQSCKAISRALPGVNRPPARSSERESPRMYSSSTAV